jgi:hypothetical protein
MTVLPFVQRLPADGARRHRPYPRTPMASLALLEAFCSFERCKQPRSS